MALLCDMHLIKEITAVPGKERINKVTKLASLSISIVAFESALNLDLEAFSRDRIAELAWIKEVDGENR